jgi:hypothetical protein
LFAVDLFAENSINIVLSSYNILDDLFSSPKLKKN